MVNAMANNMIQAASGPSGDVRMLEVEVGCRRRAELGGQQHFKKRASSTQAVERADSNGHLIRFVVGCHDDGMKQAVRTK